MSHRAEGCGLGGEGSGGVPEVGVSRGYCHLIYQLDASLARCIGVESRPCLL